MKTRDNKIKSTCKGVKKHIKEQILTHEKYLNSLKYEILTEVEVYQIHQKKHKLFTKKCMKTALNPFNDKVKYILNNFLKITILNIILGVDNQNKWRIFILFSWTS